MFRLLLTSSFVVLTAATASAQAPTATATAAPAETAEGAEKVRCKRFTETGSLAKVRKECHTEAVWRQLAEQGRADARDMVQRSLARGGPAGM